MKKSYKMGQYALLVICIYMLSGCGVCRNRLCINTCDKTLCQGMELEQKIRNKDSLIKDKDKIIKRQELFIQQEAKEKQDNIVKMKRFATNLAHKKGIINEFKYVSTKQSTVIDNLQKEVTYLKKETKDLQSKYDKKLYVIQYGDSLSKIAFRVHGKNTRWPLLWWSNKSSIAVPNLIYVGQKIYIERHWDKQAYQKAEEEHYRYYPRKK